MLNVVNIPRTIELERLSARPLTPTLSRRERETVLRQHASRSPSGFTLLEMSLAMALAGLLFVTIASLGRNAARQKRFADAAADRHPPLQLLAEQIRRDCVNARHWQVSRDGLRLFGLLARDPDTRVETGRPAEVAYRVAPVAGTSGLLRRETSAGLASSGSSREEIAWAGVTSLEVVPLEETLDPQAALADPPPPGMRAVPPQWLVVLRGEGGKVMLRVAVRNHWEDH